MSADTLVNLFLFFLGLAGFVGLFVGWPVLICIVLLLLGWGILIIVTNDGGSGGHGGGWDFGDLI